MSQSGSGDTRTTGSGSIEISVPTDLTVTSEFDSEDRRQTSIRRHAKDIHALNTETSQLHLLTEKLRLELKEKEAQLLASKAQYEFLLNQNNFQKELKLSEKQAKVNGLEAELLSKNEELRTLKERAAKELAHLLQKCLEFQQNQSMMMVKYEEIKSSLNRLDLSDEELISVRRLPRDQLNLQQFVSLRVHEITAPMKLKVKELEAAKLSLESTLSSCEKQLENKSRENAKISEEIKLLRERLLDSNSRCEEMRDEIKLDDYRVHNFDRIKRERDKYERERETLLKEKSELELTSSVWKREKNILEERINEVKSKLRLQEQELSKYKNEYFDTKSQLEKGNEDKLKTTSRLRLELERSEDIHEKYLKARAEIISLSDSLQDVTNEAKILKENFLATSKAEKETKIQLNEIQKSYDEMKNDVETLQLKYYRERDSLKLEISELRASHNSLLKTYNDAVESNAKLLAENQASRCSAQDVKLSKDQAIMALKQEISNQRRELNQYKALEDDYMSTLRVFASASDQEGQTGHYFSASSVVKGKLTEQTISLTRRILHLERQNVEACSVIRKLTTALDQMRYSISSYKSAIGMAGRPSGQLLDRIRSQEEQIILLEEALKACNESKEIILRDLKTMEADLKNTHVCLEESLLQKEEVVNLKKEISNLKNWILQNGSMSKSETIPAAIKITKGS